MPAGLNEVDFGAILQQIIQWTITSGFHILLVIVVLLIALRAVKVLSNGLIMWIANRTIKRPDAEYRKRIDTLRGIINRTISIVLIAVAAMVILGELGINLGPILAAAGIIGLAVGFGSQKLVEDIIAGFFILLEDQIRTGDVVQIAGRGGLVERVDLRMIVLRDLAGNVHYVRNGQIDVITNMTKEYSRYVFDIGVAYRENVDEVIDVIKQVDADLREDPNFKDDILEPIEVLGLDKFDESAVIIKARIKTQPIKQWNVAREFNRRLKAAFDERNIEIPFPHRTLYIGQDKQGRSTPLNITEDAHGAARERDKTTRKRP